MEIADYLAVARRNLLVIAAVPVVAMLLATAFVLGQPKTYIGTAVVGAPALVGGQPTNQYTGTQAVTQFAAAFSAAADSRTMLREVADATGEPIGAVDEHLVVDQIAGSSMMRLTYTTSNRDAAVPVAQQSAGAALRYLFGPQVALAQQRVDEGQQRVDGVHQELAELYDQAGTVDPVGSYDAMTQLVSGLEQGRIERAAVGEAAAAASIASAIADARARLDELAPHVLEYRRLAPIRDSAQEGLAAAQQALVAANAQLAAADPNVVVTVSGPRPADVGPALLQKVPAAGAAGLLLAIALVVAFELLVAPRRGAGRPGGYHRREPESPRERELALEGRR